MQLVMETQIQKNWRKNLTVDYPLTSFQVYVQQREALLRFIDELFAESGSK